MEEIEDANDWEYRAEGNLHVIIANRKTRQVLRLLKCSKERRIYGEIQSQEAIESELSYVRHVAHPLLRNCKACFPIQRVLLRKDFLNVVSEKVEAARPSFRLHKSIDHSRKFGILMPDFCQVIPPPPNSGEMISVEIKPKQGFILTGHNRCEFSQFQRLKVQSKVYERESGYCPVDLFSGCKKRMQKAIKALISDPQNNLRVFKNGGVIYSQEQLKEGKAKETFKSMVLSMFASHISHHSNTEKFKRASHNFKDLLCNLLLHPVSEQNPSTTHTPQHCEETSTSSDVLSKKKRQTENDCKSSTSAAGKLSSEIRLSSNCTLGLLLSLQKLESRPITEYYKMYRMLESHLDSFPGDSGVLSLEGPYNAHHWKEIVDEILCGDDPKGSLRENEDYWMQDITKTASLLRKFLIATSFKDCSLIMSFQLKNQDAASTMHDLPMTIKTRYGQEYWASLALVDSDPKPSSRIPEYYNNARTNAFNP